MKLEQTERASREQLLLPGRRLPEPSLLRTHPQTAERVENAIEIGPEYDRIMMLGLGMHSRNSVAKT